jgi:hypothetical protein
MEMAKLFCSGRYAEAVQIFDRILQVEPNWSTLVSTHQENTFAPATSVIALQPTQHQLMEKQSAAHVGRFNALALLSAQNALHGGYSALAKVRILRKAQETSCRKTFEEGCSIQREH